MVERVAVGYLRKSVVREGAGEVSHAMQEGQVRALAEQHGNELVWLEDWGVSGSREKEDRRPGYRQLLEMIEANQVSAVYGYSLSRFTRSLQSLLEFAELAVAHRTDVFFAKEGPLDFSSPIGRLLVKLLAMVAEFELDLARQRASDAVAARRERGDVMGNAPYGWVRQDNALIEVPEEQEVIGHLIERYAETRSLSATASWLNDNRIVTKSGRGKWVPETVKGIVKRHAPGMVTAGVQQGRSGRGTTMFSGLLVCHCGSVLAGRFYRGRWVSYTCKAGAVDPAHPKPVTISERKLWRVIQPVVSRIGPNIEKAEVLEARIKRIEKERVRLMDQYQADVDGRMTLPEYTARLAGIAARIDRARRDQATTLAIAKPHGHDRSEWNLWLRRVYDRIELGRDLVPVRYVPRLSDVVDFAQQRRLRMAERRVAGARPMTRVEGEEYQHDPEP